MSPFEASGSAAHLGVLVHALADALQAAGLKIVTAESCTGGGLAAALTDPAGASEWFERGYVTYSNESKVACLGVRAATLAEHGAVSQAVALEMAMGALARSEAQVALAVTGIAGPSGAVPGKPVGTVHFAWASAVPWGRGLVRAESLVQQFSGERTAVRHAAVCAALRLGVRWLQHDWAQEPPVG